MKGKIIVGVVVLIPLVMGAFMYYQLVYAYYAPLEASAPAAAINLVSLDGASQQPMLVGSDFQAIDADTSPLRFRACFVTPMSLAMLTESYEIYEKPTPLYAPSWFSCFDAEQIGSDLEAGTAVAFLAGKEIHPGVDRVVAVYPDGRTYAWQQLNESAEN